MQPGPQDQPKHKPSLFILELGRARVAQGREAMVISIFSLTVPGDTFERAGSMGVVSAKQTARSWVWEARQQTVRSNQAHKAARGLFKLDPAKVTEAENILQNSFSQAGSFGF